MNSTSRKNIVIVGGGIVGCTCAYYLTRHPAYDRENHSITILEATNIASGSSGKAGGLLQIEAEPACLAPLSFKLHMDLANEHHGRRNWGYRAVNVGDCSLSGQQSCRVDAPANIPETGPSSSKRDYPAALGWILPASVQSYKVVGTRRDSAQVHPYLFTTTLAGLAEQRGVVIIRGTAIGINYSNGGAKIDSVSYRLPGESAIHILPTTETILAAGPWTSSIFAPASIGGAKSHSIVIRPSKPISDNCLWANISPGQTGILKSDINLELYPRPDNTLYSCEWADPDIPLSSASDQVEVDKQRCKVMRDALASVSDELDGGEVLIEQACYQPVILRDGRRAKNAGPLLGPTGIEGLLLACGHDSWGVQNAPATGLILSEMVLDGRVKSADVRSLDPRIILKQSRLE